MLLEGLAADVVFLQETWNKPDDTFSINNYKMYFNNRKCINRKSPKGSGGVAIALKDTLFEDYSVEIQEENEEGMLALTLTNKWSNFKCALFCVYLAPENSVYGDNTYDKFEYLVSSMYDISNVDLILVGGDFNAR